MKKKIITLLLIGITFFSNLGNIKAEATILNVEEVDAVFKRNMSKLSDSEIITQIDNTNKKYVLKGENSEEDISFNIGEDYIEYENEDVETNTSTEKGTEETVKSMLTTIILGMIIHSVVEASGIEGKTLSSSFEPENFKTDEAYNKYGIKIISEHFEEHTQTDNFTSNVSYDIIKYMKLSLNTEKIQTLINTYGEDINKEETDPGVDPTIDDEETNKPEVVNEENKEDKQNIENPDTGAFMSVPMLISLLSIGFVVILLARKYTAFRRL